MKPTLTGPQKQMIVLLIGCVRMTVTKGGVRTPEYFADVVCTSVLLMLLLYVICIIYER